MIDNFFSFVQPANFSRYTMGYAGPQMFTSENC